MKNDIEKILKGCLKKKIKVTLSLLVSFMIMGNISFSEEYLHTIKGNSSDWYQTNKDNGIFTETENNSIYSFNNGDSINIKTEGLSVATGISFANKNKDIVVNNLSTIYVENDKLGARGINIISNSAEGKNTGLDINGNIDIIAIVTNGEYGYGATANGIYLYDSNIKNDKIFNISKDGIINIKASVLESKTEASSRGIEASGGTFYIGKGDIEVFTNSSHANSEAIGIITSSGNINKDIGNLYITSISEKNALSTAINGKENSSITLEGGNIRSEAIGKTIAIANGIYSSGKVQVGNSDIEVIAKGDSSGVVNAYGVKTLNDTSNINLGITNITTNIINGNNQSRSFGLYLQNGGTINMAGGSITSSKINSDEGITYAIYSTGNNAILNINKDTENQVIINGDIYNESGILDITFNKENSILNGKVEDNSSKGRLEFSNNAIWNNNGNSTIANLNMDNGLINNMLGSNIIVKNYIGNGTLNMETFKEEDGSFTTGSFAVNNSTKDSSLDVNYTGITADDITTTEFETLVEGSLTGEGLSNTTTTVNVVEGLTEGAITGSLGEDGKLDVKSIKQNSSTSTIDGLKALSTNTFIAWKQEMNSLNKRMGELRNSIGNHGVWARVYGGESEYNSGYENKFQTYQVGYDKKYPIENGTLFAGYLVSYTQGTTDYNHNSIGSGDNTSVGAGMYGSWIGKNGDYLDVIFRVSRLENDYDIMSKTGVQSKGDYDTLGVNLGLEYGKRFNLDNNLFVEPSVGMNFGRVNSVDYTTSSGVEVKQDTIYTTEGRVGAALGYSFTKGNVYVRAAGVKEFDGKIDTTMNGNKVSEDLGDSWLEYGVGMNYRVQENLNLYVDLERTGSAEVKTNWQGNLGFRYEF